MTTPKTSTPLVGQAAACLQRGAPLIARSDSTICTKGWWTGFGIDITGSSRYSEIPVAVTHASADVQSVDWLMQSVNACSSASVSPRIWVQTASGKRSQVFKWLTQLENSSLLSNPGSSWPMTEVAHKSSLIVHGVAVMQLPTAAQ